MYIPSQAPAGPAPYAPSPGSNPGYYGPPAAPQQYGQASPQAGADTGQGQYPQYPYPKYHNPYYDGISPRAVVTDTLEWFFTLPSNIMNRFSNFIDSTVYPQAPATHGGTQSPGVGPPYPGQAPAAPTQGPAVSPYANPGAQVPPAVGR